MLSQKGIDIRETHPLSQGQEALWFIHRFAPESPAWNIGFSIRIVSELDIDILRLALQSLIDSHACLRTSFSTKEEGPALVQNIYPHQEILFEQIDVSAFDAERLKKEIRTLKNYPFNLEHGPLFRVNLLTHSPKDHTLLCMAHQIVCDTQSLWIILNELPELYFARKTGLESPKTSGSVSYADFVQRESEQVTSLKGRESLNYWEKELKINTPDLPVLNLPFDYPQPRMQSYNGETLAFTLNVDVIEDTRNLAEKENILLSDFFLAAFQKLLYRYTRQSIILTGIATDTRMTEFARMVGNFTNFVGLRSDFSDKPGFREFLRQVRESRLRSSDHQTYPFPSLVKKVTQVRDHLTWSPIFQVLFAWQNGIISEESRQDKDQSIFVWKLDEIIHYEGQFDLVLDIIEENKSLKCAFRYNSDLFKMETIERMARHFQTLLQGIVKNPDQSIGSLPLLTDGEKQKFLVELNQTTLEIPPKCVHELFQDQVRKTPDAVALVFCTGQSEKTKELTYSELSIKTNALAYYLKAEGVKEETIVGLCMERSLEMIVGILAILKAGGAYMPMDPAYPDHRLRSMLEDSKTTLVLTHHQTSDRARTVLIKEKNVDIDDIEIDYKEQPDISEVRFWPDSLASIIYTSGSTGKPKGVMITHRNLCNTILRANYQFGLIPGTRVAQFASLNFVMAAGDIFSSICSGATLYMGTKEALIPGDPLTNFLDKHQIDVICMPSSSLALLSHEKVKVKNILVAAEPCPSEIMKKWAKNRNFFIGYGLTEATGGATSKKCSTTDTIPLIGRPNPNMLAYILDEDLQPLPVGVAGELYIGGEGITRGYLNNRQLTEEKFIPNPFSDVPGSMLCRTGDMVKYLPGGDIAFLYRCDFQINIRGFRIESGEIEVTLDRHPEIKQSVVIARKDNSGHQRLIAYFVPASNKPLNVDDLRDFIGITLPEYMVPGIFVKLDKLPMTPNGKIDRMALPEPTQNQMVQPHTDYTPPENEIEKKVAEICKKILLTETPGINDNFFEMGADSLLLVRICDELQKVFQCQLPVIKLFEFPTIRSLGKYMHSEFNLQQDSISIKNAHMSHQLPGESRIIVLSALNQERLKVYAGNIANFLSAANDHKRSVTLDSVAYTLQIGRKAMNERLAFVVSDLETVAIKLKDYSEGKKTIDGLYTGNAKNEPSDPGLSILQGREGAEFIRIIIEDRKLDRLAQLWVSGSDIDWRLIYPEKTPNRILLPTYPFEKIRHCIEPESQADDRNRINKLTQGNIFPASKPLYYQTIWEKEALALESLADGFKGHLLIFDTQNIDLAESLRKKGLINESQLTVVKEGKDYHVSEQGHYVINPKNQSDYQNLVQSLFSKKGLFPENIIHFWSHNEFEADPDALRLQLDHGFYSLFYLTRTLMALKQNHGIKTLTKILYVFKNGSNTPQPQYAALSGFSKSLMIENSSFFCKTIGVDAHMTEPIDQLADIIIREFSAYTNKGMVIQYANGERFSKKLLEFDHDKTSINDLPLKKQGVYMITGGMGGLGLIFGEYLASEYKASLILTGRSDLTPEKHEQLRKLKSSGAEVLYLKADVANPEDMERVFNESKTKFKGINGIIHSAGVIRRGFIRETTQQDIDQVLLPKVEGTIYLDQYFKDEPLDFFVLFSSISSEIESLGLPAYSVANAFLDNFAELREGLRADKKRFGKTLFINWPLWKHGGMQPGRQTEKILSQTLGMTLLKTETGLNAFTRGLTFSQTGFMVIEGDPTKIRHALQQQKYPAQENLISDKMVNPTEEDRTLLLNKIINDLTDIASRLLKIKKKDIDPNKSLNEYGFDSLSLTEFAGEINEKYQFSSEPITPPVFFEFTTISAMSAHLLNAFTFDMVRFYRQFAPSVSDREININESVLDKSSGHEVLPLMGPSVCLSKASQSVSDTCDIAIIGMSGVFPQSEDIHTFWQHLENGNNLVTEIPIDRWDWQAYDGDPYTEVNKTNVRWGGFMKQVDRFDPMFFNISPREACLMDPQQRIFLETAWKCIEDAGYKPSDLSGTKTGLFVGISNSGYRELISQQNVPIESHMATGTAASIIANRISYLLNLHGPSEPVDTACSSSLVAIHQAVRSIQNNDCELAIAGGVNIILMPTGHIYLAQSGMLSPDGKCKTFDKDANGFVRGEGTAAVFLKPLERAIADRDYIYGIIKGTAVNHGGRANFLTAPNTAAQADLLITAYDRAGIDPSTIGYIETHGTGTELGDPVEVDALKKAFSELYKRWNRPVSNIPHCGIGSVKTNIGHLEAASGMAGLVKTILAINHGKLPCTLHFKEVNPYIQLKNTPFYIVDKQCPWKRLTDENGMTLPRRAGVSSFGFGGTNAHVIIEEYMNKRMLSSSKASQFEPCLIVFSAKSNETLMIYAKNLSDYLNTVIKNENLPDLSDIAYTLQVGREAMQERLAVLVSSIEELIEKLTVYTHHGKKKCEGLYAGSIGKGHKKENLALMRDGEEGKRFVEEILQNRKMDTLAQVWVSGAHVDWERLYPENAACRVPLPSYPFEKRRYWIPDEEKTGKKETLVHVLKDHDVLDDLKSAVPMNGLISTLNRTGVMLEDLTDLSRSFAWYAGGCGDEVLDIGCAYGVATIAALEQGANVLAVDMEQHHLDILSERITEETKQCLSIKQGLLPDIDFEDERFGAIHASRVIHFLSPNDIQKTIKKMFRWLKPGGKLFLITDTPYVGYWQSKFLTYEERKAEGDLWPGYIKDVATVFDSKEVDGAPSLINPLDPDTLCREVMAAGFSVEQAEFIKNPSMSGSVKPGKEHAGVIAVKPIRFIRSVKPDVKPSVKLSDINHTRRFTNQKIPGQISLPKEKNPKTILSFDNVSICYEVQGHASPALVFVHGLGCNRTYWDKQVKYFSANHQVVTIDLPGHGDSGLNRDQWTIKAFGKDVVSVIEHLGLNSIILIGHSMGGPVIIEAASYLEKQLIGSVGVDTFHNLLMKPMTQQEVESVCERIKNYGKDSLQYILDPKLKEYIETCRESLTPEIRDEAFKDMVVYMQTMNTNFHYPFILINSSQWLPTNIHSAEKCNVEVRLMDKVGHFCMMEDSETFNTLLSNAISEFQSGKEAKKMINLQPTSTISMKNINNSTVQQTIHSLNPLIQQPPEPVDNPKDIDANKSFDANESLEDICSELQESLARELFMTSDEIDKKIDFVSLGLDSIYAVTWVRKINSQYGLSLKATELYSYPTINDLATFILKENKKSGGVKPVSLSPIPQKSSIILEKPQEKTDRSFVQNRVITKKIDTNSVITDKISPKKHLEASCDRREKVAIIGMSGRFPKANNLSEYWNNIIQKRDCISEIPDSRWNIRKYYDPDPNAFGKTYCKYMGILEDVYLFDPEFFKISPREAESMDPQHRLFLQAAWHCIEDAGYAPSSLWDSQCGVFAGCASGSYAMGDVSSQNILGLDNSLLPARIAYVLNLKGPCMAISTACSASLVALATACDSLVNKNSDMAIAGGVFVVTGPAIHIGMSQIKALSPDGRCFAFDQRANGFVPGEGVGVVLLKRLSDAEKDGDMIYGVIKGWGINQDGKTNGITAPNPESQARLEQEIYTKYSINPEDIQLVEAHGTGTKLGDPIEFNALCKSFQQFTKKENYCALGSVKSNIGHLAPASGIAGLIKVLLALKHGKLPPTTNFDTLNDHIDIKNSPFYMNTECRDWPVPQGKPRTAAISSFGYSGTNVHVVIEEYAEQREICTDKTVEPGNPKLVVLSAKDGERLNDYAKEMADFVSRQINNNPPLNLLDIAYTLQVGRNAMEERMAVIVHSLEELKEKLTAFIEKRDEINHKKGIYWGQTKKNKETMSVFSTDEDIAKSIEAWIYKGKYSKLLNTWVKGMNVDWNQLYFNIMIKPRRISLPTYPFSKKSYRIIESTKQEPDDMRFNPPKLHSLIGKNISTLYEQSFCTTLTGKEFYLADHVVAGKKMLPGVAFIEMARAAAEISTTQRVYKIKNIVWAQPLRLEEIPRDVYVNLYPDNDQISYEISTIEDNNRTIYSQGKLELKNQSLNESVNRSVDIDEVKKRCKNVKEKDSLYRLFWEKGIQYGSGFQVVHELVYNETEALSLIKLPDHLNSDQSDGFILHPGLMDGSLQTIAALRPNTDDLLLPFSLREVIIDQYLPTTCYAYATTAKKGKLPTYDIQLLDTSGNLLVEINDFTSLPAVKTTETVTETVKPELLYFKPVWKNKADSSIKQAPKSVMIFDNADRLYSNAVEYLDSSIIWVKPVDRENTNNDIEDKSNVYRINAEDPDDYKTLVQKLSVNNMLPDCIVYNGQIHDSEGLYNSGIPRILKDLPFYPLLYLTQAMISLNPVPQVQLIYMHKVASPVDAAVSGFARTVRAESSKLIYKTLELENLSDPKILLNKVMSEFSLKDRYVEVRYRGEDRQVRSLMELDLKAEINRENLPLKNNGVYLITGGMGGLGRIFTEYITTHYKAQIILSGRSDLSSKTVFPGWQVHRNGEIDILGSKKALYIKADISNQEDVQRLISTVKSRFNAINGIIHGAGVIKDAFISKKTGKEADQVIAPKVPGTYYLDEETKDEPLDFFVLFSSGISVQGNPGQCDYAYANSFMDYFSEVREMLKKNSKRSGLTISFNWPLWKEGGMQMDRQREQLGIKTKGNYPMPWESGISAYEKGLLSDLNQLIIFYGNGQKIRQRILKSESAPAQETSMDHNTFDKGKLFQKVQESVSRIICDILKLDSSDIDLDADMSEYGFDSISLTELINKVNDIYNLDLMPAIFFEYPTVASFISHLCSEYKKSPALYYQDSMSKDISDDMIDTKTELKFSNDMMDTITRLPQLKSRFMTDMPPGLIHSKTSPSMQEKMPIAIIGISGIMPQSEDLDEFWNHLVKGDDLITEIPKDRWNWEKYFGDPAREHNKTNVKCGGFMKHVDQFDASFFGMSPYEAEMTDPQQRIFLETVWTCIEDSGYRVSDLSGTKTGVFVGVGTGDYSELLKMRHIEAYTSSGISLAVLANRISYLLNLRGPSEPINTACSSSLVAVHRAAGTIWNGECDMAIAGGINVMIRPTLFISFSKAGMLSKDGRCKTFDKQADGYGRGEGVGAVLLKPLEKALIDNDHIYAVIRATSVNHGGHVSSLTVPNPRAQAEVLVEAYTKSKIDPDTISYIEAHGTGTALGDPVEINGLKKAFQTLYENTGKPLSRFGYCGIGSVKTNIGHLESAAGIASLLKVVLSMKHKMLPASIHLNEINPQIQIKETPFYIVDKTKPWEAMINDHGQVLPRIAGISSFGFGGSNAHVVIEEFTGADKCTPCITDMALSDESYIFVLSAKNDERLREYAKNISDFLKKITFLSEQKAKYGKKKKSLEIIQDDLCKMASTILKVNKKDLDVDTDFAEYGFDPFSLSYLSEEISKKYTIETDINIFSDNPSINALSINLINRYKDIMISYYPELADTIIEHTNDNSTNEDSTLKPADIAYTLQIGREPMEERLAILVSGIHEFIEKLDQYLEGHNKITEVYTGSIKANKDIAGLLTGNTGIQLLREMIDKKEFRKIASLWVRGLEIDWQLLYPQKDRSRVSLPTYPFARERYWIMDQQVNFEQDFLSDIKTSPVKTFPVNKSDIGPGTSPVQFFINYITDLMAEMLKIDPQKIDPEEDFEIYGLDSIVINNLNSRLEQYVGKKIPSTLFFTYKSIRTIAEYFAENHKTDSIELLSTEYGPVSEPLKEKTKFIHMDEVKQSSTDIAIIGLSGQFPMAGNMEEFWENLKFGKDCITEIPKARWDYQQYPGMYCKWGGFLDDFDKFDPQFFNISPNTARSLDPQARLFLQTVWSCLEDAGYTRKRLANPKIGDQRANIGVFAGVTYNEYPLYFASQWEKGNYSTPVSPQIFSLANRVSHFFNFSGPSLSVDTACSSSLYAVHLACESIVNSECEMAVAGGVNLSLHPLKYMNLCRLGFASTDGRCRSFAKGGDGYVPGEGVAVVLLKPLEKALRDHDHIRGIIKATAVNHDGKTYGYTVPNPVAQSEVIQAALGKAHIDPRTISYVEAHGTGTALGDPIEITGLTEAYKKDHTEEKKPYCVIGSVKANIGHLEAAAGIAQLAKVILQLEHKTLTPLLLHSEQINPDIDFENTPFFIKQKTEKWKQPIINGKSYPRRAGISSFGAGGVNVHVIVQEYEGEDIPCHHKRTEAVSFYLIPLSANTEESLKEYVKSLEKFLRHKREEDKHSLCLRDIAYTLQIGRESMRFRAAFVVKRIEELIEKLNKCLLSSANDPGINGLFYGQQKEETEEAFFLHNEKEINRSENILEQRNLNDIAQRWTKGETFDWTALYLTDKPRLISLPTYPFLKQRYWIVESPNLPDESPQIPPEIPVEQNEDSEYDPKISSAEVSHFLMELAEAPEKEQEAMISNFLQKRIGCLLGFAPDHLPALDLGFFAMGMESMQTLTLQAELEDTFRIKISDTAAFDYPDIKTFSGYLLNLIPFDELEMDESHLPVEQLSSIDKEVSETVMDSQYLYQGPLPDDIMNMDIKEVEKCLNTEMAYFSKKI